MAPQTDGFYLVNCSRSFSEPGAKHPPGTVTVDLRTASGIAYYADMFANRNNQNEQPTNFVYTNVEGNTQWETGSVQQATFHEVPGCPAFTFCWTIGVNAQSEPEGSVVGTATVNLKGEEHFTIYKDNGRELVTLHGDGYQCFSVYLCQKSS